MPPLRSNSTTPNRTAVVNGPTLWKTIVTIVGIVTYIVAFYRFDSRTDPVGLTPRQLFLSQLLVPDDLISSWVENDWSRLGLLDHVPVLAGAALILLVSALTGWLVLHGLRVTKVLDAAEQFVIGLTIGLNLWSLLTLALGLGGFLRHRGLFAGIAVAISTLAIWKLWRTKSAQRTDDVESVKDSGGRGPLTGFGRIALWMCVPLALVVLLGGTLPATHFDVREYHLQVPKEWYQQGRVTFLPHNVYGNMPLGAEMHAILGMLLASGKDDWWWGALIGKTVIAAFGPLGAAGVYLIGRRFVSSDAGAWGSFAYLSTPWIAHVSMTGLIDGAVACYVVMAVFVALCAVFPFSRDATCRLPLLAVSGFLAGGAVACKYPALLFLVAPLGLIVSVLPEWRVNWKAALIFALAIIAGCGLWFGKNWVQTGNPTYPLLYSVFDGRSWNAEKDARWTKAHGPPRDADGNRYSPSQLWDSIRLLAIGSDHHGPWILPLAIAALWSLRSLRSRWLLGICVTLIAIAIGSWWLLTHRVDRFLVPILPLAAVAAGMGATWTEDFRWRRAILFLAACCGLLSFVQIASPYAADNRFLIALSDLRTDLPRSDSGSQTRINDGHRWLNQHVRPGDRVLLVGEAQVFDLEMPILYNTCFDDCVFETLLKDRTREERLQVLRDLNISHIFVSWYELNRYRSPGNYGYSEYPTRELFYGELVQQQGLLRPLAVGKSRDVYEIFEVVGVGDKTSADRSVTTP